MTESLMANRVALADHWSVTSLVLHSNGAHVCDLLIHLITAPNEPPIVSTPRIRLMTVEAVDKLIADLQTCRDVMSGAKPPMTKPPGH